MWRNSLHRLEVCEEFFGFCSVSITNAEVITLAIVGLANSANLNLLRDLMEPQLSVVSGVSAWLNNSTQTPNILLTTVIMPWILILLQAVIMFLTFVISWTVLKNSICCDIYKAHRMAQRLVVWLEIERTSDRWQEIIRDLAIKHTRKIKLSKDTTTAPTSITDLESYYRVGYYFAFLDHTLSHLITKFPPELEGALLATSLLPGYKTIADIKVDLSINLWKWSDDLETQHCCKVMDLLCTCNFADDIKVYYPNLHTILLLLLSSCQFLLVWMIVHSSEMSQDVVSEFDDWQLARPVGFRLHQSRADIFTRMQS